MASVVYTRQWAENGNKQIKTILLRVCMLIVEFATFYLASHRRATYDSAYSFPIDLYFTIFMLCAYIQRNNKYEEKLGTATPTKAEEKTIVESSGPLQAIEPQNSETKLDFESRYKAFSDEEYAKAALKN